MTEMTKTRSHKHGNENLQKLRARQQKPIQRTTEKSDNMDTLSYLSQ